jgi:hypothetical protein
MLALLQTQFNPGDVLAVFCTAYTHYSIISDQQGLDNKPMLISASNRTGTVREEVWSNVVGTAKVKVHPKPENIATSVVLENARSQIGSWTYSLKDQNCEHFVNWCSGLGLNSKQVRNAALAGGLLAFATALIAKDGRVIKTSIALVGGAALGVAATKGKL